MPFMPLSPDFPAFDPVLVQLGPFADPLVCARLYRRHPARLGLCARADPQRALWGGPAPMTARRFRRFRALGDARHHPRRPHRLRAVLQPGAFRRASAARSCSCGRAACRSTAASSAACWRSCCSRGRRGIPILSLGDITCAVGTIGLFLGRIANFINGELWGRPTDVPWAMVFPGRRAVAAPSEPALRGDARRAGAARRALAVDARAAR